MRSPLIVLGHVRDIGFSHRSLEAGSEHDITKSKEDSSPDNSEAICMRYSTPGLETNEKIGLVKGS